MNRRRGFTLVELLVVVGIIALLVTILMPTLTRAKELARDAVCKTNLKNIFYGLYFYADDWEGWLPPVCGEAAIWWPTTNNYLSQYPPNARDWQAPRHYVDRDAFLCPSDPYRLISPAGWPHDRGSYGLNRHMTDNGEPDWVQKSESSPNYTRHYKLHETLQPSKMYLVGETGANESSHLYALIRPIEAAVGDPALTTPAFRHRDRLSTNMLFHDGHIEPMTDEEIPFVRPTWGYLPWFNNNEYKSN
ncbi:MAG: type II secretion system protein [Planctomycetota bacterium]|jgi:prepilin-type N-terminal cleavage/methylation domain-containing protein/prepilin-type processing-associated H-X9-DG protein